MSKHIKIKLKSRPRNLITLIAISKKGGLHQKSKKAIRRSEKYQTQKLIKDCVVNFS